MDESVKTRLIEAALAIEKFRNLDPKEQEWLMPLLSRGFRSTLQMLNVISLERKSFEEIALEVGIHPQTAQQKLNALLVGGLAIDLSKTAAYAPTGRPRKLARKL